MNKNNPRQNPYVGPRAFREGELIFGRGREQRQLFQLLLARRIALLHSPSGAGKSSLIQAGLIPKLKEEGFNVLPTGRLNAKPPEPAPPGFNRYINSLLLSLQEGSEERLDDGLAALSLAEYLAQYDAAEADSELRVLIVDQFEEVLTADPTDLEQKAAFFAQVGHALRNPNLWALFVIREDYLGALEPYVRAIPTRLANSFRLDLLDTAAASDAIRKPAATQDVQFTDEAVDALVDDLRRIQVQQPDGTVVEELGPYVEPVQLQVVCYRLWGNLSPGQNEITVEDLETIGNVDESLAAYYAERAAAIAADPKIGVQERDTRKWVHDNLITKDGIRMSVLKGQGETVGLDNRAINMLQDAHLVRADERAGMTWYELAHDRLVKPVRGDNLTWFNKHLSLLQRQAQRWQEEGRPDYILLDGPELREVEDWAKQHPDELFDDDRAFLEASRKERAARVRELDAQRALAMEQRKRAEEAEAAEIRQRRLARIALLILVIAIIAAGLASYNWFKSNQNAAQAQASAAEANDAATKVAIAITAHAALKSESANVLATSNAAYEQAIDSQATANAALATAAANPLEQATADMAATSAAAAQSTASAIRNSANATATALPREVTVFEGHRDGINSASFSPNGRQIVTASSDGSAKMWDVEGNELASLDGHESVVWSASFSPDGRQIVTASSDNTARLWDGEGTFITALEGHAWIVRLAVFNYNGSRILTASADDTARLWDGEGAFITTLEGHAGDVSSAAFNHDGSRILTASADRTARLWDGEGAFITTLEGHTGEVFSATFSHDGSHIVTASFDGTARLRDGEGAFITTLEGHAGPVISAAFNHNGSRIVTASADNTVRLWFRGQLLTVLVGHTAPVVSAVFSPDGEQILTASGDTTARLWNVETGQELAVLAGHTDWVNSAVFSPDGKWILTASDDNTARLWRSLE